MMEWIDSIVACITMWTTFCWVFCLMLVSALVVQEAAATMEDKAQLLDGKVMPKANKAPRPQDRCDCSVHAHGLSVGCWVPHDFSLLLVHMRG